MSLNPPHTLVRRLGKPAMLLLLLCAQKPLKQRSLPEQSSSTEHPVMSSWREHSSLFELIPLAERAPLAVRSAQRRADAREVLAGAMLESNLLVLGGREVATVVYAVQERTAAVVDVIQPIYLACATPAHPWPG